MPDAAALQRRIARLFLDNLHLEIPSADTDLFDSGVLDSMAFVELLALLEQEFGVEVTLNDVEIDNFRSMVKIAEFVERRTRDEETA